jgi:uncharacterized protein YjaG (DUF416 family)
MNKFEFEQIQTWTNLNLNIIRIEQILTLLKLFESKIDFESKQIFEFVLFLIWTYFLIWKDFKFEQIANMAKKSKLSFLYEIFKSEHVLFHQIFIEREKKKPAELGRPTQ